MFPFAQVAPTLIAYAFTVTDADLVMTDGRSLEGQGVVPDEPVLPGGADLAAGRDPVMARAAALAGVTLDAAGNLFYADQDNGDLWKFSAADVADGTLAVSQAQVLVSSAFGVYLASAGNRQTLIAALLPAHTASTHTLFCLRTPLARREQHYLAALLNSFVLNHLVRLRVSTHVTTAIVERLPVPTAAEGVME